MDEQQSHTIEQLYMKMQPKLMVYAYAKLQNEALAEEAVQEVFRIACLKADAVCSSKHPEGWLVITLRNVLSNMIRSQQIAKTIMTEYIAAMLMEQSVTMDQTKFELLYEDIADTEEFLLLKEMVIDRKSILEMAQARAISVDACKKRVQRAKETLKKKISK